MFKNALIPMHAVSFGFQVLKDGYSSIFGDSLVTRSDARKDLVDEGAILAVPGYFSWGKKAIDKYTIATEGFKRYGEQGSAMYEMTPAEAFLEFFEIKLPKGQQVRAMLSEMRDLEADESYRKSQAKVKAADLYEKGHIVAMNEYVTRAREEGIPIRPSEVVKFSNDRTRIGTLRTALKGMRKDLRPHFEEEIKRLEEELFPSKHRKTVNDGESEVETRKYSAGERPLWGGASRGSEEEE
jgi:hypothetical protein